MDDDQREAVECLILYEIDESSNEGVELEVTNDFQQIVKKQKSIAKNASSQYLDLSFLMPTSNVCERFFSKCGFAMNDRRGGLCPANAEAQMFLHMNMELWDIATIKEILTS